MSFILLWQCDYAARTHVTLAVLILSAWLGTALILQNKVAFPLRTLSNLLGALREGDYSLRARGARLDDALGEVIWEVNALAESLREQRLGAMEATALLRKVLAEIDVAMFGFDSDGRLQLVNDSGRRLLGRTGRGSSRLPGEDLGLAECLEGETPRVLDMALPGRRRALGVAAGRLPRERGVASAGVPLGPDPHPARGGAAGLEAAHPDGPSRGEQLADADPVGGGQPAGADRPTSRCRTIGRRILKGGWN